MAMALASSSRLRSPCDSTEAGSKARSDIPQNSKASRDLSSTVLTHSPLLRDLDDKQGTITLATTGKFLKGLTIWKVHANPLFTFFERA